MRKKEKEPSLVKMCRKSNYRFAKNLDLFFGLDQQAVETDQLVRTGAMRAAC